MTTAILKEHERLMQANRIMAIKLAKSYGWLLSQEQEQEKKLEEKKAA